jgi:dipeptidyl aminopeptidase/acylaminoacyl peptidase
VLKTLLRMLAATLVALGLSAAVRAQTIPSMGDGLIEDYLRHVVTQERFVGPVLSPSGRYLMMVERPSSPNNSDRLLVFDLDSEQALQPTRLRFGNFRVEAAQWIGDDHIVVFTSGIVLLEETEERGLRLNYNLPRHFRTVTLNRETGETEAVLYYTGRTGGIDGSLNHVVDWLDGDPDHVLMMGLDDDRLNLYRVNILTADIERVEAGRARTVNWFATNGRATLRVDVARNGRRLEYFTRAEGDDDWHRAGSQRWRNLDEQARDFEWLGVTGTPGEAFVRTRPDDADTTGIYRFDFISGELGEALVDLDGADVTAALVDANGELAAYTYVDIKTEARLLDEDWDAHLRALADVFEADESVIPLSVSADRMAVFVTGPRTPGQFYVYDRRTSQVDFITEMDPMLARDLLRPMERVSYQSGDGIDLHGFVSYPSVGASPTTPLVVLPHGGPEQRDELAFNPIVQYLTGLGYAVFQPNFRGSSGFGRTFAEAGNGEWGGRARTDIDDGVRSLIADGRVDPDRICMVGFSYGGYAALVGVALSPDLYQCAVAGGAPADLIELLRHEQRESEDAYDYWREKIGDPRRERDLIEAVSPVELAGQITAPVFLYHGEDDPVVPVDQSRRMARALRDAGAAFRYHEKPGGLHDWGTERDFVVTMRNIRAFLADAIDGELDTFQPTQHDRRLDSMGPLRDERF